MQTAATPERVETIVIGGGQAGLSVGYQLARRDQRVPDPRRRRARRRLLAQPLGLAAAVHAGPLRRPGRDALPGAARTRSRPRTRWPTTWRPTPPASSCRCAPASASTGCRATAAASIVTAGERRYEADNVVIAMSSFQRPRVPAFAAELDPRIVQLHSSEYRTPASCATAGARGRRRQLRAPRSRSTSRRRTRPGCQGATSGTSRSASTALAGRVLLGPLVLRGVFHRVLTTGTPIGRRKRAELISHGHAARAHQAAGPRRGGGRAGRQGRRRARRSAAAGGRTRARAGQRRSGARASAPTSSWLDLPGVDDTDPATDRGVVAGQPGLYFVGLMFLYSVSSTMIHGLARDAEHVADHIAARARAPEATAAPAPGASRRQTDRRTEVITMTTPAMREATDDRARLLAGLPVAERRLALARHLDRPAGGRRSGTPLVLLHGPGEFAAKWWRVLPQLVATHRVLAPDLPAHGASETPGRSVGRRARAGLPPRADRPDLREAAGARRARARRRHRRALRDRAR